MSGQLVDASIVAAPKQRNTQAEKQAIKEGRVPEDWQAKPAKLRQKDRDARWTVKTTKAKPREGETPMVDLAIPAFGYQNHISADRRHRLIRRWLVTDAAAHAGARLADLLDPGNTASGVWADTGYRSKKNEDLLRRRMLVSHIHRKKPAGRPMPERTARANARKSAVRAHIEHVFAEQKARMGLFVRTIGLARATTKIGLANLVYNMRRLLWLHRQPVLTWTLTSLPRHLRRPRSSKPTATDGHARPLAIPGTNFAENCRRWRSPAGTFFFGRSVPAGTPPNLGLSSRPSEPRGLTRRPISGRFPSLSSPLL